VDEKNVIEVECYGDDLRFLKPIHRSVWATVLKKFGLPANAQLFLKANLLAEEGLIYLFYNSQFCCCIDISAIDPNKEPRPDRTKDS
jgi:hypothetical protein